jgi:hypothetical protein
MLDQDSIDNSRGFFVVDFWRTNRWEAEQCGTMRMWNVWTGRTGPGEIRRPVQGLILRYDNERFV